MFRETSKAKVLGGGRPRWILSTRDGIDVDDLLVLGSSFNVVDKLLGTNNERRNQSVLPKSRYAGLSLQIPRGIPPEMVPRMASLAILGVKDGSVFARGEMWILSTRGGLDVDDLLGTNDEGMDRVMTKGGTADFSKVSVRTKPEYSFPARCRNATMSLHTRFLTDHLHVGVMPAFRIFSAPTTKGEAQGVLPKSR